MLLLDHLDLSMIDHNIKLICYVICYTSMTKSKQAKVMDKTKPLLIFYTYLNRL